MTGLGIGFLALSALMVILAIAVRSNLALCAIVSLMAVYNIIQAVTIL